jgi:hypothetical protein
MVFTVLLALLAAGLGSGVTAIALGRRRGQPNLPKLPVLDAELEKRIDSVSTAWAAEHGEPEAGPLLATKLRLICGLSQQTRRRRRRWWR